MIHHEVEDGKEVVKMELAEEVAFINKAPISSELENLPENSELEIDVTKTKFLDNDIVEIIDDFLKTAKKRKSQPAWLVNVVQQKIPRIFLKSSASKAS